MSNPNPNQSNLRPIKKGERRAAKSPENKRTKALKIMLTPSEFANFSNQVDAEGEKSMTSLARKRLGFD